MIGSTNKKKIKNLVKETIVGAFYEDINIRNEEDYEEAKRYLIKEIKGLKFD